MTKKILTGNRFLYLLVGLFFILRLPSLFEPYWYGDEGIYLVLGQAVRKGLVLYSQIHDNKPPTLYYLAALAHNVFGFRLLLMASMAGATYFFWLIAKKLLPASRVNLSLLIFVVITSIPVFEGNIANAEIFMLLPTLIGIYCFLTAQSHTAYLLSGLFLGLSFTLKVPVFVEFGFLCLWYLLTRFDRRKIYSLITDYCLLIAGFIVPVSLYAVYFWLKGAFPDFIFAALLQNFGYLSSWATGSHSGSATGGGLLTRAVILLVYWTVVYFFYLKKFIDKNLAFISFWFGAAVFGALLSSRPYPHYLIQILPSLVLIISLLFASKLAAGVRGFLLVLILGLSVIFFKFRFYVYPVFSYYVNFYTHIFSLNSPAYRDYFGSKVDDTYRISAYLKATTDPRKPIFVWGDEPYIYALSDRLPLGKYTVAYHIADFNQYDNIYQKLIADMPDTIVYFPQPYRPFPKLDDLLSHYYAPVNGFGDAVIYHRL